MKLAAIDIGSNAARLLVVEPKPYQNGEFDYSKLNFLRIPLKLGYDVFNTGYIGPEKMHQFNQAMQIFKQLMELYGVQYYRACATSAMRDAKNASFIVEEILRNTGIEIEIITGQEEASILYETHVAETLNHNKGNYLYMDVGGGSTELSLYSNQKLQFKESFNVGTIRLLQNKLTDKDWEPVKQFIKNELKSHIPYTLIGSGGNINKLFSLSKTKEGKPLKYNHLKKYLTEMSELSVAERMHEFNLREDRASVIVPALKIYTQIMRWAEVDEIFVPKIGLADGIVKQLHQQYLT